MIRRVVTGKDADGKPVIVSDGEPPRTVRRKYIPGFTDTPVWTTSAPLTMPSTVIDPTESIAHWVPKPGETLAMVVTFPPDAVFADPAHDPAAAREEHLAATPGLAELFEHDAPGMHTTPTIDYGVVLTGRVVLDLGDGVSTDLGIGDVVVQNGTRHAWRNPGTEPATVFFVLMGYQH